MNEIRIGSHVLQPHRQLLLDGKHVHIGPRALSILTVLSEAEGKIVTKDELFEAVWPNITIEENALQAQVTALRKVLGDDAERLTTIRGIGYQLALGEAQDSHPSAGNEDSARRGRKGFWLAALFAMLTLSALALWQFAGGKANDGDQEPISVLVHEFSATNDSSDDAALASGITDELILRLRRVPNLIISTGRAGQEAESTVLYGSVRRDAEQLRVSVRLEDAGGTVVWSENFDRQISDLFYVQEEIASAVARSLSVPLDAGVDSLAYGGTENPQAYALFVEGNALRFSTDRDRPLQLLGRAIELDPDYVRALWALSNAYAYSLPFAENLAQHDFYLQNMGQYARAAEKARPDLWFGHDALSWYYLARRDLAEAARERVLVIQNRPENDPDYYTTAAYWENQFGRIEESEALFREKAQLDPFFRDDPEQITTLLLAGKLEEVVEIYERHLAREDSIEGLPHVQAIRAYLLLGRKEDLDIAVRNYATAEVAEWANATVDSLPVIPNLSNDELVEWARRKWGAGTQYQLYNLAFSAGALGEQELALQYLRLATKIDGIAAYGLFWTPALQEVRQTQEFKALLQEIGMVDVWRESGDWGDFCRNTSETEIACE